MWKVSSFIFNPHQLPAKLDQRERFAPTLIMQQDQKPYMKTYPVDLNDCGPMVLDALIKIKNEQVWLDTSCS